MCMPCPVPAPRTPLQEVVDRRTALRLDQKVMGKYCDWNLVELLDATVELADLTKRLETDEADHG